MASKKLVALALVFLVFGVLTVGCCCAAGPGTGGPNFVYTGKPCNTDADCRTSSLDSDWHCENGACQQEGSIDLDW